MAVDEATVPTVRVRGTPEADSLPAKSTVRTVGNSLGKEILRGVLGGILGNKKR